MDGFETPSAMPANAPRSHEPLYPRLLLLLKALGPLFCILFGGLHRALSIAHHSPVFFKTVGLTLTQLGQLKAWNQRAVDRLIKCIGHIGRVHMCCRAMFRTLFVLFVVRSACADGPDLSCSLQKRPPALLRLDTEKPSLEEPPATELAQFESQPDEGPWSTPGVRFQQCGRTKNKRPAQLPTLLQAVALDRGREKPLPDRVRCPTGQMLIGNFLGNEYNFSCCDAGQQCGGCRKTENGTCQECAAGYVHQQIPLLNVTKCFLCDDVPGWQDSYGLGCRDYASKGFCHGFVEAGHDEPFHGVRPSEACCVCGGGSVQPTPTSMPFAQKSLVYGDVVDEFPEPQALGSQVSSCNLAEWGLHLSGSPGRIQGNVSSLGQSSPEIKCSLVLMQDPIRGISATVSLKIPLASFSYGQQLLVFKYWGLDPDPATKPFHLHQQALPQGQFLENFQLQCNCPRPGKLLAACVSETLKRLNPTPVPNDLKTFLRRDMKSPGGFGCCRTARSWPDSCRRLRRSKGMNSYELSESPDV